MKEVNILGTKYTILEQTGEENPKMKDAFGICEYYSKKLVVSPVSEYENNPNAYENIPAFRNKVLRHEVIHAFFAESGLRSNSDYAENEELVDWIAIQFPKIAKAFKELEIEE